MSEGDPASDAAPSASTTADDRPAWTEPWVDPPDPPDSVAVVGAGAVGVTAARDLAAAGVDVTLFERGPAVGAGSSGRAAGIVYDAFAEAVDARVGRRALARLRERDGDGGFALHETPYLMLAREGDGERAAAIETAAEGMARAGVDVAVLDGDAVSERFPIRGEDVAVAAVCRGAGWCDPGSYVDAVTAAARGAGVRVRTGVPARVRTDPVRVVAEAGEADPVVAGRFDAVVVAAGAWTKRLLADAGVAVALKPYRVQALTAAADYDGPIVYDATAGGYFRPHPTGVLAGDGTVPEEADPDGYDRDADGWFVDDARALLERRAGVAVDDPARAWAGLCAATPDRDPLLGELRPDLYVACGWQGHGFMRAPATAEALVSEAVGGPGIDAFDPKRFDGDECFSVVEGMVVEE